MNDRYLKFQMDNLFSGLGRWLAVSSIAACVFAFFLYHYIDHSLVAAWLSALLTSNLLRGWIWYDYTKKNSGEDLLVYRRRLRIATFLSGAIWGSAGFVAAGNIPHNMEGFYVAFMMGVVASGSMSNLADIKSAIAFACLVVVPNIYKSFIDEGELFGVLVTVQILFLYFIIALAVRFSKNLVKNLQLLVEKELLLHQLTERFDLERQLKEEKLKSLQASKFAAIGEMAAGVGHEINNPLTIVLGYHWKMERLLKEKNGDPEILELVRKSSDASKRIADIVRSMRDFSRMKNQDELEVFKVSFVVDMVRPLLDKTLRSYGVSFKCNFEDCYAQGLQSEFAQVLYNLITNAIHACEGQEGAEVELIGGARGDYCYLSVSNPGPVIPEHVAVKMFQPFFTTKDVGKGTGLGLSLAKTIMENNQGEVYYERRDGKTLFTMKMRKAKPESI